MANRQKNKILFELQTYVMKYIYMYTWQESISIANQLPACRQYGLHSEEVWICLSDRQTYMTENIKYR